MDGMDEIIGEFLVESNESLDRLDRELIELEADPTSRELLASIFRTAHTIKGTAGFLGFGRLEMLTHAGENLLALLRDGKLVLDSSMTSALLAMVDQIRGLLAVIERTGSDAEGDGAAIEALTATLEALADPDAASPPADPGPSDSVAGATLAPAEPARPAEADTPTEAETPTEVGGPASRAPVATTTATAQPDGPNTESSIRVDVRLLDQLMNLVGELVLARNQILQFTAGQEDTALLAASQQLNLITTELQEGVMKTRMQPIGNIWGKFPRVVRDLATLCEKRVRIEMEGEDTELDKTIIEAIKDPLTHVVRNAVDHGIETPEERRAAGKPVEGVLRLRAYHEGGQVIIEVSDDGAGLDHAAILEKAVERGLVSSEQASRLTDREIANLIFLPGFSTARAVTNVSGRGVGMDVVKTNIEKIGGTLDVQSERGAGTTLTIKIPLTLAIIPALIVTCDGDRYAIPQVNLVELLRLEDDAGSSGIEYVSGAPVYRLRGRLLPIVHLRELLGLPAPDDDQRAARHVVVLHADNHQFGLVVDQIDDTAEIVVKPLGPHLKPISVFAGTTIMGDGTVALILDTIGIGLQGGVMGDATLRQPADAAEESTDRRRDMQTVVVCAVGDRRVAIPIALVSRLEELDRNTVERAGGRLVVQYRGDLLSLVSLTQFFDPTAPDPLVHGEEDSMLQVLVHETESDVYGFVVDEIVDIAEIDTAEGKALDVEGVLLSGVIGRRVTDLVDIEAILRQVEQHPVPVC
ncbi:MAG TPA: chemotaxis protein CheW [Acidimicrobiales bacterium]